MKYIPYGHQSIDNQDINAVIKVLKGEWITQGPKVREFEKEVARYCGAKYAVAVSSGTAALHIACLTAGIKKGDEVITSAITFVASANCILYCAGKPVFADIEEDTINIDPQDLKKKITKKTKAVIPVHFAGHPCDLEEIQETAKIHNLIIIEDAACALGAVYKGSRIGSCKYSDMAVFSFHPVKQITTGEGGMVLTNNRGFYEKLLMYRNHGIVKERKKLSKYDGSWYYEQQLLGFNYRITDFQCALGISQLNKIDSFTRCRRKIADIYSKELSKIEEIELPKEREYVKSARHIYYIRIKNIKKRKIIFEKLQRENLGVQVHYIPLPMHPFYKQTLKYKIQDFPKAGRYYQQTITLPLFPKMKNGDIAYVVRKVKEVISST